MTYIQPLLLVFFCLCVVGISRSWRELRRGRGWLAAGLLGLFATAWPPVAWLVSRPLEGWYARGTNIGKVEAIVALSGGVFPPTVENPLPMLAPDSYLRCQRAADLYRTAPGTPVLVCGGIGPDGGEAFAATMRRFLVAQGVPETMIWTEERSGSTYENAAFGADILRQKGIRRIALVTEAYHMPRAERCFRKQGFDVVPAPCGFLTLEFSVFQLIPGWRPVKETEQVLHEVVGMGWYWMRGRI